jgi:HEPN domain-containing protein
MARPSAEVTHALLNNFALRSFRDIAGRDSIAVRMAYRAELLPQAFWASQQALEKYLKAILLFRRIPCKKPTHSLEKLLVGIEKVLRLDLSARARSFIAAIDEWDVDRYISRPRRIGQLFRVSAKRSSEERTQPTKGSPGITCISGIRGARTLDIRGNQPAACRPRTCIRR